MAMRLGLGLPEHKAGPSLHRRLPAVALSRQFGGSTSDRPGIDASRLSSRALSLAVDEAPDGRGKPEYLGRLGYSQDTAGELDPDLREQILSLDAQPGRPSPYGQKYDSGAADGTKRQERLGPHHLDCPDWRSGPEAGDAHPGGETMTLALYQRVVLTQDMPKEGLRAGDVGVIVEHYPARADVPEGYELEVFAANGQTVAVVSVPASAVREATEHEVLSVREMARA